MYPIRGAVGATTRASVRQREAEIRISSGGDALCGKTIRPTYGGYLYAPAVCISSTRAAARQVLAGLIRLVICRPANESRLGKLGRAHMPPAVPTTSPTIPREYFLATKLNLAPRVYAFDDKRAFGDRETAPPTSRYAGDVRGTLW